MHASNLFSLSIAEEYLHAIENEISEQEEGTDAAERYICLNIGQIHAFMLKSADPERWAERESSSFKLRYKYY